MVPSGRDQLRIPSPRTSSTRSASRSMRPYSAYKTSKILIARRAGFSFFAHSSREIFQRCRAADLARSSSKFTMRGFPAASDSSRVWRTRMSSEGSSHPASSHAAISLAGSGGRVSAGRWTFRTNPSPSSVADFASFALALEGPGLAAPRFIDGCSGRLCNQRLHNCSSTRRLAGLRCWLSASR